MFDFIGKEMSDYFTPEELDEKHRRANIICDYCGSLDIVIIEGMDVLNGFDRIPFWVSTCRCMDCLKRFTSYIPLLEVK